MPERSAEAVGHVDERSARRRGAQRSSKTFLPVATFRSGRVPAVSEVSPYGIVGVSPSKYHARDPFAPYVGREVDHFLDGVLDQRQVALLVGGSKAGKSRTAFEAVRRVFPASKLLVPAGATRSLAALVRDPPFDPGPDPPVLWLDELDRYLGDATGLDRALLDWIARRDGRMVIVGTIDRRQRDALLAVKGEIGRSARLLLEQAEEIPVPTSLTARERTQAEWLYPGERFVRGIGEHLVDAPALERDYDRGRLAVPVGWALVQAAADWRRTGILRPVPEADLKDLSLRYVDPEVLPGLTSEQQGQGLAWACRQLAPEIALLQVVSRRRARFSLRAFDHIVAYADRHPAHQLREIPPATWELVLARASPEEALRVGFTAYVRGDSVAAEAAWSRASASRNRDVAPWAAENLRMLHRLRGDARSGAAPAASAPTAPPTASQRVGSRLEETGARRPSQGAGPDPTWTWRSRRFGVPTRRPDAQLAETARPGRREPGRIAPPAARTDLKVGPSRSAGPGLNDKEARPPAAARRPAEGRIAPAPEGRPATGGAPEGRPQGQRPEATGADLTVEPQLRRGSWRRRARDLLGFTPPWRPEQQEPNAPAPDGAAPTDFDRLIRSLETLTETLSGPQLELYKHDLPQLTAVEAARRVRADIVALLLDNGGGMMEVSGGVGLTPPERQMQVKYDGDVMRELCRAGVGLIEDTGRVRGPLAGVPGSRAKMLMLVPLVHKRRSFGLLMAGRHGNRNGGPARPFSDAEVLALKGFADAAAASLHAVALLRQFKRRFETPVVRSGHPPS
jgi:hypothetical protein